MTPEQFCYWLQGYAEMGSPAPTDEQWQMIKDHLGLVFKKETPARKAAPGAPKSDPFSEEIVRRFMEKGINTKWPDHSPVPMPDYTILPRITC